MIDLVIVGGGPAGMSAGIYSAVYNLDARIIAKEIGGTVQDAPMVENYPGVGAVDNQKLIEKFQSHLEQFNVPIEEGTEVKEIEKEEEGFSITTEEGEEYLSKAVLIATGTKDRELDVPGEEEYKGKGVSYCAICDAPLYKDAVVGVVGGSDAAAKEALLLSEHAEKVYIIYRGEEIHPEPILKRRVDEKVEQEKIKIINNTNVTEIKGEQMMETVELDNRYRGSEELELEGLFIAIGGVPLTAVAEDLEVELNDSGEIKANERMETSVPGAYAAGDVTNNGFKQIITAAYQGSRAVKEAYEYIKSQE